MLYGAFFGEREFSSNPVRNNRSWEYEHRNVVLPNVVDQVRARRLVNVSHPASQQGNSVF